MAQKRATKPPPPPPAASSEETDSGSQSEESEDEAVSPTPVPNKPPAPPQKGAESESSDEEEEGDEEEEEEEEEEEHEEPTRAAPTTTPKNQPPPPQQSKDSDTSEEEEEEDEDEDEEPTDAAPPSAPKKQPAPLQKNDGSDASDEEGEEGESSESDEEAPLPKPSPKREAEDINPPSAKKARVAFHRIWSTDDEVRILEALAAHQKQHGALPQPDALIRSLAGKLDNRAYGSKELQTKLQNLKRRYVLLSKRGELPSKEHDRRLLDLSKIVWGGDKTTTTAAKAANGNELKGFEEMCELYPYLAEEVKKLEAVHPGMFKRVFGKMDDLKARALDEKTKKQRIVQMKVELRHAELVKEVTKAIVELVD